MTERIKDKVATVILYSISFLVVGLLVFLIGYILYKGSSSLNPHFLFSNPETSKAGGGIGPMLSLLFSQNQLNAESPFEHSLNHFYFHLQ